MPSMRAWEGGWKRGPGQGLVWKGAGEPDRRRSAESAHPRIYARAPSGGKKKPSKDGAQLVPTSTGEGNLSARHPRRQGQVLCGDFVSVDAFGQRCRLVPSLHPLHASV